ncbi:MAG TPA: hypothetical protein PLE30_01475 [Candidatus Kapabacteria bacterium]|nr:hypothetical protein [Candidatus Kapabacteria bacterium]
MKVKLTSLVLLLSIFAVGSINAQYSKNLLPNYMRADFFNKFPEFYKFKLGQKVKYREPDKDVLQMKPSQLKFLSSDGIESINISGSIWSDAQTETWIALDYNNPSNIIATANDNVYLGGADNWRMSAFVTTDAGKTWFHSPTPRNYGQYFTPNQNRATIFDPAITFDSQGNVYYAYGYAETYYDGNDKNKNGVFVVKSTDKGKTWDGLQEGSENGIVAISTDAFGSSNQPFHDRYTISADRSATSPYKDNVYISWRAFGGTRDGIVFSYSSDGGESWSDYQRIATGGQAPMPVTNTKGDLYICWIAPDFAGQSRAMVAKSVNGGASFSTIVEAQKVINIGTYDETNGRYTLTDKQNIRVSSTPQIAVDNSNSPYKNNLYVVQAGRVSSDGEYGIYLSTSTNGGLSWQKNKRIDANPLGNDMFMPSITVDPTTGWIGVFYYSSQNDNKNIGVDGYCAISKDGGSTWQNIRVTPETKYLDKVSTVMPQGLSGGVYWGDYTSIIAHGGSFYPLYWMPTIGNNFTSNDLFTAYISPKPRAPENLTDVTEYEPEISLKLKWTHPTKNLFGEDIGNFKIVIYKGNDKIGEVNKNQTPEFSDFNVSLGNSYHYRLQTETEDGLKSTFAEIDALVGGNPKPNRPTNISWAPVQNGVLLTWQNPSTNVDGHTFMDHLNLKINNLDNNSVIEEIDDPSIQVGNITSYLLKVPTEKYYKISLQSVGVRGSTKTDSDPTDELIVYSGNPLTEIQENFDGQKTTPYYNSGDWQLSNEKAFSAPNSLTDGPKGDYKPNTNTFVMLAPVVLSQGKSTFSFKHIALLSTVASSGSSDIGEISYSNDLGKSWKILKWVDAATSPNFKVGDLANSTFDSLAFNLADKLGDTLIFRFRIQTNALRNDEGWFIDNIAMDDRPSNVNDLLEANTIINVTPNPNSGIANLNVNLPLSANLYYSIYNSIGEEIYKSDNNFYYQGMNVISIELNNKPNGIYYIRLNINNTSKTVPFSIVR